MIRAAACRVPQVYQHMMKKYVTAAAAFGLFIFGCLSLRAQSFVHPGINQSRDDLAYMKELVHSGRQPWKGAFDRLKASTDTGFTAHPFAHVLRGPYDKPDVGGTELSKSARMAYNCALLWYITDNKAYAHEAIAILNAWSGVLWDFDYNDAKLLAAWTGHVFCNAAEILRYTRSGWKKQDMDRFTQMLMTVYYPLLRHYFPTANGNWDGAIIHTLMAIAIFTDNRTLFNNAVDHFLHGPVNGSLFKYIYPNGECQESPRDQGHVQLGEGEFAGAAKVAWTQGVDLFSIGSYRIARGLEYTAGYLLGEQPYCYCILSARGRTIRDDYACVYQQYKAMGVEVPYIRQAALKARPDASRSILSAVRASFRKPAGRLIKLSPDTTAYIAGAGAPEKEPIPGNALIVPPQQSLQAALDSAAGTGRWVVAAKGLHVLKTSLRLPSGVTLAGEGDSTVLFLSPESGVRDAIINGAADLHDVTIRDLVVEGSVTPVPGRDPNSSRSFRNKGNRGGIIFRAESVNRMHNLNFINLTVRHCTYNGVFISGARNLRFLRCNFNENGAAVVPGPTLQHNLLLTHCSGVMIRDSRLDTSPDGAGISLNACEGVSCTGNEVARNAYYGIVVSESKNVTVNDNLLEGNDSTGIMLECLYEGSDSVRIRGNLVRFNGGNAIASYGTTHLELGHNACIGNGTFRGSISDKNQVKVIQAKKTHAQAALTLHVTAVPQKTKP